MSYIIDRRHNAKNKSAVNRQRFLERYKHRVKDAVADAINRRSITDMERGEDVTIPANDISEPVFQHGAGGRRSVVHPGNKEFVAGDRFARPGGGAGGGSGAGDASNEGEGTDDFVFRLTEAEFLEYLFEDLALPNLTKRHLKGNETCKYERAGFTSSGNPSKLCVVRSLKTAKARRIALSSESRRQLKLAQALFDAALVAGDQPFAARLRDDLDQLQAHIKRVPFLDTTDLRYKLHVKHPVPTSQAVMFCLMDVSGSMDEQTKATAKRFYLLLYLFLKRNYEKTEVVFIRHHTTAKEVDEQEFFHSRETGGTVVSSALTLMAEIIEQRYAPGSWNIYGAQASDGDNWVDDSPICRKLLHEKILPMLQHFAYVEITRGSQQALWREYERLADAFPETFAQRQIREVSDIYRVFHDLFQKKVAA